MVGAQASGEVDITVMCSPESILVDYYRKLGLRVIPHKIRSKVSPAFQFAISSLDKWSRSTLRLFL